MLTEIKIRGTSDVCIVVCDGLTGLPDAVTAVWPQAIVQTCVIHMLRNTFRYLSRRYWDQISEDVKPVYTAPTEAAAKERFAEFAGKWGGQYSAIPARGHFPTEQAARQSLYLVTRSLDPAGRGKPALGSEVEASAERVRDHLRRPDHPDR